MARNSGVRCPMSESGCNGPSHKALAAESSPHRYSEGRPMKAQRQHVSCSSRGPVSWKGAGFRSATTPSTMGDRQLPRGLCNA